MITRHIDYLQYNMLYYERKCIVSEMKKIAPVQWYKRGYEDALGVRYYFGNPRTNKALIIMSGKALHNYRVVDWKITDLLREIIDQKGRVSRIDLAVTEYVESDEIFQVSDIAKLYTDGKLESSHCAYGAKTIASLGENYTDGIETLYIGDLQNRGKKGIFRSYDKSLEMDIGRFLISRIEIEDKRDKALVSARRLADGNSIGSVFRTRMNSNTEMWNRLMDADEIDISRGAELAKSDDEHDHENRKTWLLTQVAPAMAKVLDKEPDFLWHFLKASGYQFDKTDDSTVS